MKHLAGLVSALGGAMIAILVAITTAAVFMRYILGMPLQWTEEVSGILMIWIVMLGAISCEWRRQHLTIDFAVGALPPAARRALTILVALASIAVLVLMAWLAWNLAQTASFKRTQILRVSWFWLDLAVVVGALGTAIVTLHQLFFPPEPASDDQIGH